ncbi:glycosyltransferase family A protein [Mesohalobacter halotolerans]|uniref:Glycosyltransferase family 2 protein n=1 Tax=Mesohalobacter halotolerans TaxID=1883405 RepID=A0A4U5TPH9_9FLAO|nr:glycosyltransferase family A protein [Mesohalobacter halotolerans]MBS3739188.1 glycosyltransferase family 2 protein [Psychroflexus sp.]TKS56017.1 glycosyltransferase family 2 protein [Mesohalobacter halotolerans]
MNRTDLDFLSPMFKHYNLNDVHVLIINQTSRDKLLESDQNNIRVINAFERGLSKSRNLAITNAIGDICFIADDDIEYLPNAIDIVIKAYRDFPEAALISFQYLRENDKIYKTYQEKAAYQNKLLHKQSLTSMEITFNSQKINKAEIRFNTIFSFGERFHWFEEAVFRDDVIRAGLKVAFVPKPIVKHYGKTSVPNEDSKAYTQALTAQKYLQYKNLIYLWLIRYIWILIKRRVISCSQILQFWKYGVNAIQDYKRLSKAK